MGALQEKIDRIAREISEERGSERAENFRRRAKEDVFNKKVTGNGIGLIAGTAASVFLGPVGLLGTWVIGASGAYLRADDHLDDLREIYLYE